ncbi:hypothetical protein EGH21_11220 [Halomicroarcula sp. F13]|uniref:Uncharacterized protein n=1 Tax=Haloarcula rubra TaxID=2487747 RepID=A0AAW4PR32_9EURY|nr:hypothetical protein [Halomicroarcula rubra]MBX0323599.1 hypothetical protein [Halomicroarcula rubra]
MNRRRVLAALGTGLAGLAGCQSEPPSTPGETSGTATDDQRTDSPTSSRTDVPVTVEDVVVRKAITYESSMGSGGVLTGDDRQYVVGSVRGVDDGRDVTFTFETDDGSWEQGLPVTMGARNHAIAGHERPYVAFTVPSPLSASNPRIRRSEDGTTWPLSQRARETLAAPAPRFELDTLTAPENVSQGEQLSVSLTATNVSETDGRFLAAVYWPTKGIADDDESHVVERSVAAGDSITASLDIDTEYTAYEDGAVTLSVAGHVTAEREIRVEDTSTPT